MLNSTTYPKWHIKTPRQYYDSSPAYESLTSQRNICHAFFFSSHTSCLFFPPFLFFIMNFLMLHWENSKKKPRIPSFSHYHVYTISLNISVPMPLVLCLMDEVAFVLSKFNTPICAPDPVFLTPLLQFVCLSFASFIYPSLLDNFHKISIYFSVFYFKEKNLCSYL